MTDRKEDISFFSLVFCVFLLSFRCRPFDVRERKEICHASYLLLLISDTPTVAHTLHLTPPAFHKDANLEGGRNKKSEEKGRKNITLLIG